MKMIIALFLLVLGSTQAGFTQKVIDTVLIKDASFEQQSRYWKDCGVGEPIAGLHLGSGKVYKMVRQRLSEPMLKDKCYTLTLKVKQSKLGNADVIFPNIRIWGGKNICQRSELIGKTGPVTFMTWTTYKFKLNPKEDLQYIILEAYVRPQITPGQGYFSKVGQKPYAGHVILGHISNIYELECDDDDLKLLQVTVPEKVAVEKTKKIIMPELNKKISKGQVMRIRNLHFDANSTQLLQSGQSVLDELFFFLKENPSVNVELGGHTNNLCDTPYCNSLSEKRAQAVVDYLVNKGIMSKRLKVKGYGKTNPIKSNSSVEGRKTNQRVEVKILSQ